MNKRNLKKLVIKKEGFSLIEMMVVLAILSIITIGLVTIFSGGMRSWIGGQNQLQAQREARQAMDRMVREIREGSEITTDTNTKIIFDTPWITGITYEFLSNTLYRDSTPLINNVSVLDFDASLSKIHILMEVDVDEDGNPDITLNTDVNLRNYGL